MGTFFSSVPGGLFKPTQATANGVAQVQGTSIANTLGNVLQSIATQNKTNADTDKLIQDIAFEQYKLPLDLDDTMSAINLNNANANRLKQLTPLEVAHQALQNKALDLTNRTTEQNFQLNEANRKVTTSAIKSAVDSIMASNPGMSLQDATKTFYSLSDKEQYSFIQPFIADAIANNGINDNIAKQLTANDITQYLGTFTKGNGTTNIKTGPLSNLFGGNKNNESNSTKTNSNSDVTNPSNYTPGEVKQYAGETASIDEALVEAGRKPRTQEELIRDMTFGSNLRQKYSDNLGIGEWLDYDPNRVYMEKQAWDNDVNAYTAKYYPDLLDTPETTGNTTQINIPSLKFKDSSTVIPLESRTFKYNGKEKPLYIDQELNPLILGTSFNDLPNEFQEILNAYGVTKKDWDTHWNWGEVKESREDVLQRLGLLDLKGNLADGSPFKNIANVLDKVTQRGKTAGDLASSMQSQLQNHILNNIASKYGNESESIIQDLESNKIMPLLVSDKSDKEIKDELAQKGVSKEAINELMEIRDKSFTDGTTNMVDTAKGVLHLVSNKLGKEYSTKMKDWISTDDFSKDPVGMSFLTGTLASFTPEVLKALEATNEKTLEKFFKALFSSRSYSDLHSALQIIEDDQLIGYNVIPTILNNTQEFMTATKDYYNSIVGKGQPDLRELEFIPLKLSEDQSSYGIGFNKDAFRHMHNQAYKNLREVNKEMKQAQDAQGSLFKYLSNSIL